nr:MAG TPA: hypothetical protein [Caudoviricetes sp.]DAX81201.1 MAG TPA: hypothetical protein [Caudoviricetes sp.]
MEEIPVRIRATTLHLSPLIGAFLCSKSKTTVKHPLSTHIK